MSSSTALWYATRASGLMALILLTLTMVLGVGTNTRTRARNWPGFAQQELHRRVSMIAMAFLAIHVLTSVLDTYVHIGWAAIVVPFASSYAPFWVGIGTVSLDLMLAVFVSSLLRSRMSPGAWRALHWLAYLSWPIAVAHTFGMGTDAREGWVVLLGGACVASVAVALAWRVYRTTRQTAARTAAAPAAAAPAAARGPGETVPKKHLALGARGQRGSDGG